MRGLYGTLIPCELTMKESRVWKRWVSWLRAEGLRERFWYLSRVLETYYRQMESVIPPYARITGPNRPPLG